jgi:two-component system, OmpR family, response regulator
MKILLVEDDAETAAALCDNFKEHGLAVDHAADGRQGLFQAAAEPYDVIVLDWMLPGLDGLSMVKVLRDAGRGIPILFLTTRSGIDDRVLGLEAGADDYLIKPFAFPELLARVQALARRPPLAAASTQLRVMDLEIDLLKRSAIRGGRPIELKPLEFRLLEYLMRHTGQVVTRAMLLENVWEFHFDPQTNVVETSISRLRSKVDRGFDLELIHTVRGAGYILHAPD